MPELDDIFSEELDVLRDAKRSYVADLDAVLNTQVPLVPSLLHLARLTEQHASFAESLIHDLIEEEADEALIQEAEQMQEFFTEVGEWIAMPPHLLECCKASTLLRGGGLLPSRAARYAVTGKP